MKLPRRNFLHLAAGAAALPVVSRVARAQTYPTRPVRFILPVVAGGSTDVVARLVAEHLSRVFGQQLIVDNRSGAGGTAGMEAVAKSVPDGYTILVTSDRVASAQHAFKLNFDPIKDLAPICQLTRQPLVLAVHHSLGTGSLAEFLARVRAHPGMNYATAGVGIHQHVVGEWFQKLAGIKLALVPYRGGGQVINDLIAGHVKIAVLGSTPLLRITRLVPCGCWHNRQRHARRAYRTFRHSWKRASTGWCSISGSGHSHLPERKKQSSSVSMLRSTKC